jgi:hypothetical protein
MLERGVKIEEITNVEDTCFETEQEREERTFAD